MPHFVRGILIFSVYAYIMFSIVGKKQISAENYGGRMVIRVPKVLSLFFIPFKDGIIPVGIFTLLLNIVISLIIGIGFYYLIDATLAGLVYSISFFSGFIIGYVIVEVLEYNM